MVDHSNMRLGLTHSAIPEGSLFLKNYIPTVHFPVPAEINLYEKISDWPMMMNDTIGDCTIASVGHCIQYWTTLNKTHPTVLSDSTIVGAYSAITGYNPADPNTDQGALLTDVLNYWETKGIGGDVLTKYIYVDNTNDYEVKLATYIFGVVYSALDLPNTAQSQDVWDVNTNASVADQALGSWGGHAVPIVGYNSIGPIVVTWGAIKQMTWAFWNKYAVQAGVPLSKDWLNAKNLTPEHLTWQNLEDDINTTRYLKSLP